MTLGADLQTGVQERQPRMLQWLPLAALVALPLLLIREGARPITDPDAAWHVLLGKAVLSGVSLGTDVDPLTTRTSVPWVFHQWLPEVAAAIADERLGWWGVGWLAHLGRLFVMLALWWVCRREASRLAAVVALAIAIVGTSMSLGPRPQLIGLALLAVSIGAWRSSAQDGRPRWWLVPLTWVWACCHGTWVLGLAVGVVSVVAIGIDRWRAQSAGAGPTSAAPWREGWRSIRRLGLVPVLSGLAVLVTPVGPRLLTAQQHIAAVSDLVTEWQRPSLADTPVALTWAAAAVVILSMTFGRDRRSLSAVDLATSGMALVSLLAYQRTVAVAAVLLAPLLAARFNAWLGRARPATDGADRWLLPITAVVSALVMGVLLPRVAAQPGGVPTNLVPALSALPAGTVVLDDERLGGWLLATQPSLTPTVDSRFEAYGRAYLQQQLDLVVGAPGWRERLAATGASAVVLPTQAPLIDLLSADPSWRHVGQDVGYTLFVRR